MIRLAAILTAAFLLAVPAHAIFTEKPLENPTEEARAQELMKDLRCLVCQNQAISESGAPLARDMRVVLRERIAAGDSDEQAVNYMVDRFGDWVLLNPPFKAKTLVLWISMPVILLVGAILVFLFLRRQRGAGAVGMATARAAPLSEQEQSELRRALSEKD